MIIVASLDSSSQTGNATGVDWQEEIYQKIKSMNEMYFPELNELYQRMAVKLQQHDALPQQPKNEQLEKLRFLKVMLERFILFLRTNKNEVQPHHKEKIIGVEKQIVNILNSNRPRKPVSSLQQGQITQPPMHAMQQSQHQQSQISQMHANEGQVNSQMQAMNVQGSVVTTQQNNLTNLHHSSLSSVSGVPNSRQNMMDALQPGSSIDPALNQMQQVSMSSLQQNPVSGAQPMNVNSISSQSVLTPLQSSVNLHANSNIHQPQQIKHDQQMFSTQQLKQQYQQRQMQQQYMHRQQLLQQQQQTSQQQLPAQQVMQINQINDANDLKMRHQMGGKSGVLQPHNSSGQRQSYLHQQMKSGTPFSISSQQVLQATSPQIAHHSSPQIDQQNILTSHSKGGTPLQSANSPFIIPSPSSCMAPSPMLGDSEKVNSGVPALSNPGNSVHHPITAASMPNQSLAIGTPGISASPLLAECTSAEGTHGVASTIVSGNSNVVEQPLDRLIKVIKSMSPKALSASISDIGSVVSMVDRIAGSAPGNGSRAAVGEDLVAMTKCRLQARNFFAQDGPSCTKKMRRYASAVPSNIVSSTGSVNDGLRHLTGNESDGESTGASSIKRPRIESMAGKLTNTDRIVMLEDGLARMREEAETGMIDIAMRFQEVLAAIGDSKKKKKKEPKYDTDSSEEKKKPKKKKEPKDDMESSEVEEDDASLGSKKNTFGRKNRDPFRDCRKIKMPIFEGDDAYGWVYRIERYFEVQGIEGKAQLRADAVLCMDGPALAWYPWIEATSPCRSWESFK
ncbi:hypothetical protein OROMI_014771 [Orobanche minor]